MKSPDIAAAVVIGTSLSLAGLSAAEAQTNKTPIKPVANLGSCRFWVDVRAFEFEDTFEKTGRGRPHIFDGPEVDKVLGPATGFKVIITDNFGAILGETPVDHLGKGYVGGDKTKGIVAPCNVAEGPHGFHAVAFKAHTDQDLEKSKRDHTPLHEFNLVAENGFAANLVVGREVKKLPASPTAVPAGISQADVQKMLDEHDKKLIEALKAPAPASAAPVSTTETSQQPQSDGSTFFLTGAGDKLGKVSGWAGDHKSWILIPAGVLALGLVGKKALESGMLTGLKTFTKKRTVGVVLPKGPTSYKP